MVLLIKLLKNVSKNFLVLSLLLGFVFAQANTNPVLATNYLVQDFDTGEIIAEKNSLEVRSIASITKVMTAIIVLDADQNLEEKIRYKSIKNISSKLPNNSLVTRKELLLITLMSSDNGAAKTLALHYPGGEEAAIAAMNSKAAQLGMNNTTFTDPTGLLNGNVSTVLDLVKLVNYAYTYENIREFSSKPTQRVQITNKKTTFLDFRTTNSLVQNYDVLLSKTGWIRASGGCLVMVISNQGKRLLVVLLNSKNTTTRIRDGALLTGYNNVGNKGNYR